MSDAPLTRDVVIQNRLGLHARASAQFVKTSGRFRAEITVEAGTQRVNGKSIMGVLQLAAAQGQSIEVVANGADAEEALEALGGLIADRFGEGE